jgi:hypothetical protein
MKPAWRKRPGSAGRNDTRLPVDLINMSTAKAAVTEVIEPLVRGMEAVRPAVWVTSLSDEHRALLCIQPYKGAVFELEYGISCSWIPHLEGNRWRWHRTVRQSRRDLWVRTSRATRRPVARSAISTDWTTSAGRLRRRWRRSLRSPITGGTPSRRFQGSSPRHAARKTPGVPFRFTGLAPDWSRPSPCAALGTFPPRNGTL